MSEVLPLVIVTRLTQLGTDLTAWARDHRDAPLAEQEQAVLALARAALPDLLAAVLPLATSALTTPVAGLRQPCPDCGKRRRPLAWRFRTVATVCGVVRFERPYHYCRKCHRGWAPADASLGLGAYERVSGGLREWLAELGASTVLREGQRLLGRLTGLAVAAETVRSCTVGTGLALEAVQQAAIAQVQRTGEAAVPVAAAPGRLVVETDGVMVRYRDGQWHEVKVGVVGGWQDGKLREQSLVAARESAEVFGPRLLAEAARRGALEVLGWQGPVTGSGLAQLPEVVVLGDGAHWIWELAAEHFGTSVEIVDFYHAAEHLGELAGTLYGKGSAAAKAWAGQQVGELYEHGAGPVLTALGKAKAPDAEAGEVLRREQGYFRTNRGRMDYPGFRQQGLPIGSGAVEGEAKYLVQVRLKRPGMRWSQAGAQGVLALRAHLLSGRVLTGLRAQPVPVECHRVPHPQSAAAAAPAAAQAAA